MLDRPKPPSYTKALLTSQSNLYALLGAAVVGAGLSIPFGALGLVPLVVYGAGTAIASLYVPSLPSFRQKVDAEARANVRQKNREQLLTLLNNKRGNKIKFLTFGKASSNNTDQLRYERFNSMLARVKSLYALATDKRIALNFQEVEKVDDVLNEYLRLWLSSVLIDERAKAVDIKDIERQLKIIEQRLVQVSQPREKQPLVEAQAQYQAVLDRQEKSQIQQFNIEASLTAIPDQIEEIYQNVIASPNSVNVIEKLTSTVTKLGLDDTLDAELKMALGEL